MGKSIRDYESNGTLQSIISMCNRVSYYSPVDDLKWTPTDNPPPLPGQMVLACKSNKYTSWVDPVYYFNGMFFDVGWTWAKEYEEYDAWMPIPAPMNYRKDDE